MRLSIHLLSLLLVMTLLPGSIAGQNSTPQSRQSVVPPLVSFAGRAIDGDGKAISGIAGITFSIYKEQFGGSPLWIETQNVQLDAKGNYMVQLGANSSEGLPPELFASGEARWLGVRINNRGEQSRVLLLSVPYALKAADAQTIGGLPPSAFVLAASPAQNSTSATEPGTASGSSPNVGGSGTQNYIPLWTDNSGDLGNSVLYQTGSGSGAKLGINLTNPLLTLDVNGSELVRGLFEMATTGFATPTKGYISQPLNIESSAYNSSTSKYTLNHFQWQAEPTGNNTASPGASLNLLYGTDPASPTETGLSLSSRGLFTFAPGQTFPGTGKGTVTSVGLSAPSTDFNVSGSPVTTSGTLGLTWKVAPTNADTASAIVKRDVNGAFSSGEVSASSVGASTAAVTGTNSNTGIGVLGYATGSSGQGVWGESFGTNFAPNGQGSDGVHGQAHTHDGSGVAGLNSDATGIGVYGQGTGFYSSGSGYGVYGVGSIGVYGASATAVPESMTTGFGVYGTNSNALGIGVWGQSPNVGVFGFGGAGLYGQDMSDNGAGVYAIGENNGSSAGYFVGDVFVSGNLSKGGGSFKIDHPLDPANKYLYHSFVESPDMMNIYNGNITTDTQGLAVVQLPDWFEVLNRDFRYQLTVIGQFAQAIISKKIANRQFTIRTDKPNVEVSWQVTGIRQDPWANAHRIPIEQDKSAQERGLYLHPELYGALPGKSITLARRPKVPDPNLKQQQQTPASTAR